MMIRVVEGIECVIDDYNEKGLNESMYFNFTDMCDTIRNMILGEIPDDLTIAFEHNQFNDALEQTVDYTMKNMRETKISNGTFLEDALCFFYDLIEQTKESKDDYMTFYMKVWCKASDKVMLNNYAYSNHVHCEYSNDPFQFAVEDAIDNATERGIKDDEDIRTDVFMQLDSAVNESDIFDQYFEDYMIKNSI